MLVSVVAVFHDFCARIGSMLMLNSQSLQMLHSKQGWSGKDEGVIISHANIMEGVCHKSQLVALNESRQGTDRFRPLRIDVLLKCKFKSNS